MRRFCCSYSSDKMFVDPRFFLYTQDPLERENGSGKTRFTCSGLVDFSTIYHYDHETKTNKIDRENVSHRRRCVSD